MATVTVTIPDESAQRVATAICAIYGHEPTSPQDATDFVTDVVFKWLRDATIEWEAQQVAASMRENPDDPLISATLE